jgi:hypothetical protein
MKILTQKIRAAAGIEPTTSRTQSENHTTRLSGHKNFKMYEIYIPTLIYNIFKNIYL